MHDVEQFYKDEPQTRGWEETVLSDEQIAEVIQPLLAFKAVVSECDRLIAKEQAEISWKAREPEIGEAHKAGENKGYSKGRREVVEFLNKHRRDEGGLELMVSWQGIVLHNDEWQAFLKEGGIEE